jgi:hypothetical protein
VSADLGTYSSYGCLTVSRKPFFRLQATSFCAVPRLPAAHVPVSADLGAYLFSDCLTVSRKPFSRLQATSFCIPEIAYCSGSSEHGSRDVSIAWLSCSQPGALLPTASNIFLCSPEITSCSGSSTEKLLKNMIRRPGEQQMLLARCHIARQQAGKLFIYREHRCPVLHAETKHGLALAGRHSADLTEHPVLRTPIAYCSARCGASHQLNTHPLDAVGRCSLLLRESSSDHSTMSDLVVMPRGQRHGFRTFNRLLWVDSSIGKEMPSDNPNMLNGFRDIGRAASPLLPSQTDNPMALVSACCRASTQMWCFQIDRSGAKSKGLCEFEADQLVWLLPSFATGNIFTAVFKKFSQQRVCVLGGRDSQARLLGPGVCDPEYEKAQTIRAYAPVVAGGIHLLHWV